MRCLNFVEVLLVLGFGGGTDTARSATYTNILDMANLKNSSDCI